MSFRIPSPEGWERIAHLLDGGHRVETTLRIPDLAIAYTMSVQHIDRHGMTLAIEGTRPTGIPSRKNDFAPFLPSELSAALDKLDLTIGKFARLCGVSERTVQRWLGTGDETQPIPGSIRTICVLLTMPGAMALAKTLADRVSERIVKDRVR